MGAELPYQICEIGAIYRMWCDTQNTHLPCQSTPSLWKVTAGEKMVTAKFQISIHTFWQKYTKQSEAKLNFNPHLPCGRWPVSIISFQHCRNFNPHLPCGRWRDKILKCFVAHQYFNPHLPCGRWPEQQANDAWEYLFQSTPSLRKVTVRYSLHRADRLISIHTFLAEGDESDDQMISSSTYFNPHLPCGRWLLLIGGMVMALFDFNPHLPCGRWQFPS